MNITNILTNYSDKLFLIIIIIIIIIIISTPTIFERWNFINVENKLHNKHTSKAQDNKTP